jgi:membrane-bound lytic murein transglycosylase D
MDVRGNPRLRDFYMQLVERIYREEVPVQSVQPSVVAVNTNTGGASLVKAAVQDGVQSSSAQQETQVAQNTAPRVGFREQKFEPSPLDELSKLQLTKEEEQVTTEEVAKLEEATQSIKLGIQPHPLIQGFINYYQGRGRATMDTGLRRSGKYMKMAKRIFREEGVPEDIAWLGQVESAWRPTARSWAAASGLWQFIPGTGARFGLRQTAWIDERNSFEKATRASAKYLKWLNNRYSGDWALAMGAYNTGEGNIDRAIRRAGSRNFWAIYPYIAQETRNYVPNILATILIATNPAKYGFGNVRFDAPLSYDTVQVPTATSLSLIAQATGSSLDYIRSINPELRRDVTPRGESYNVRVPAGRSPQLVAYLKEVPVNQRDRGAITLVGNVRARSTDAPATGRSLTRVRAGSGDTVARIAAKYGVPADEVAKLNGVAANAPLNLGREIMVPGAQATALSGRPARRR